ncbi:uncharacterized protein LOC131657155 [Vicia villosa]|uniref:uncharacterized protein LOC131657155 n=1 Tax=Vicia villosa TaxID=3911 RepID=UPI00273CBE7A|nr:uncharacterized protein LOC131657155 [Vicia villosa]
MPNNRNVADGEFHYSSTQESTNIDPDNSYDDNSLDDDKESLQKAMINALFAYAEASKAKSDFLLAEKKSVNHSCSITKCVNVLNEIEDVSDDVYMKAVEKFMDPNWREVFLAMCIDRRKGWLVRI